MATKNIDEQPHHINPEQAATAATEFLLDHVGHLLSAGEPHIMVSVVRAVWIVPVQLSYIHTGILGTVGFVAVDEELGTVMAWTPISEMKEASRRLRMQHEPELSERFRSEMMAAQNPQST